MFYNSEQLGPVAEEFFEGHPELFEEIKSFEQRRCFNLLRKLVNDKDEVNFFSWLAEIRFGLFFDKICKEIANDQHIEGRTPDWMLTMNNQRILAEVLRLNTPEGEYRESIAHNRQMAKFQKENPGVPFVIQGPSKMISLEYLGGGQSKLVKKEERYGNIVQRNELPFVICVAPTLETFLFELDFYDFLIGSRGFFKRDEGFRRNVTGVLLNTPFGEFFYYHNEQADFQLTSENLNVFSPLFYIR